MDRVISPAKAEIPGAGEERGPLGTSPPCPGMLREEGTALAQPSATAGDGGSKSSLKYKF